MAPKKNDNGTIRFKVEDVKTIASIVASLDHVVHDFQNERSAREELAEEVQVLRDDFSEEQQTMREDFNYKFKDLKENYIPKWIGYLLSIMASIIVGETVYIITL